MDLVAVVFVEYGEANFAFGVQATDADGRLASTSRDQYLIVVDGVDNDSTGSTSSTAPFVGRLEQDDDCDDHEHLDVDDDDGQTKSSTKSTKTAASKITIGGPTSVAKNNTINETITVTSSKIVSGKDREDEWQDDLHDHTEEWQYGDRNVPNRREQVRRGQPRGDVQLQREQHVERDEHDQDIKVG